MFLQKHVYANMPNTQTNARTTVHRPTNKAFTHFQLFAYTQKRDCAFSFHCILICVLVSAGFRLVSFLVTIYYYNHQTFIVFY